MNDLALTFRQAGFFIKSYLRNSRGMVFTILFPIVLLVLFSEIFGGPGDLTDFAGQKVDFATYFTPGIIAYAITMGSFSAMAIALTSERESGILKRFRGTPLPPWVFIVGQILKSILIVAVMTVALMLIGYLAYGVGIRAEAVVGIVLYVLLGTAVMCALGIALTAVVKSPDSAATIGPFSAVILSFISGVFVPISNLPEWLVVVGKIFPLAHLANGLQLSFSPFTSGTGLTVENVVVLAAWGIGGILVAATRFRWEPQAAAA